VTAGPIVAVVPTWRAAERVGTVLRHLAPQVDGVVVVDNGSDDGTPAALRAAATAVACPVEVIANDDNRGYAAAVNQGLERALAQGATRVLVANDDAIFLPGAVAALDEALARAPAAGCATARLVYAARPNVLNGAGGEWLAWRGLARLRGEGRARDAPLRGAPDYPSGAAVLFRRAALADVGLLDPTYYLYYEDVDWGLRARARGWPVAYAPDAVVLHGGSTGTRDAPARRRYYNVRNRLRFAAAHAPLVGRLWVAGATLLLLGKQPLRLLSSRRRADARAAVWGVVDFVRHRRGRGPAFLEDV
jgi:GT2 family glycosyltransferase